MSDQEYDLKGREIIVVGGGGYIGAHVCKMIAENGGTPIVFDNFQAGHKHAVKWGPHVTVDLRDRAADPEVLKEHLVFFSFFHQQSQLIALLLGCAPRQMHFHALHNNALKID